MTRLVFALLVVAFATLLTTHVTLAVGLGRRAPRWHALLALFVAPLAPWWGWQARMRIRAALWMTAAAAYAVALGLSLRA
jgi:hypothetical protein